MQIKSLIIVIFLAVLLYSCTNTDPKSMAKEYCECVKNSIESSDIQKCEELVREHKETLANDPDKMQKYADELVNCTNVSR